jgi:hypothetical protein
LALPSSSRSRTANADFGGPRYAGCSGHAAGSEHTERWKDAGHAEGTSCTANANARGPRYAGCFGSAGGTSCTRHSPANARW